MARINFEDKVESEPAFWKLHAILNNHRECLGALVQLFRLAQKYYGNGEGIPIDALKFHDLGMMIDAGWLEPFKDGFMVIGAQKHFAWYVAVKCNSIKGGDATKKMHESNKINDVVGPTGSQPASPLSLAPAPALVLVKNNTNTLASNVERSRNLIIQDLFALEGILKDSSQDLQTKWVALYGKDFVVEEIKKADIWLAANIARAPKSRYSRFFSNWLSNAWEKHRKTIPANKPEPEWVRKVKAEEKAKGLT